MYSCLGAKRITNGVFVKKGVIFDANQENLTGFAIYQDFQTCAENIIIITPHVPTWQRNIQEFKNIIVNSFETFHGLEHRLELVTNLLDVEVINDSKATISRPPTPPFRVLIIFTGSPVVEVKARIFLVFCPIRPV